MHELAAILHSGVDAYTGLWTKFELAGGNFFTCFFLSVIIMPNLLILAPQK